jgi:electron-transferring-flavoprotein dehydrogenase
MGRYLDMINSPADVKLLTLEQLNTLAQEIRDELISVLSKTGGRKLPVPPGMHNKGNVIVSLGAMCAWLAPQAEALGVEIDPGFAAAETLHVPMAAWRACADMGVAKDGSHKAGYTAGIDIRAKVTVFAEGARGHLTKQLVTRFGLDADSDPQGYSIGLKELWQVPEERVSPGKIVHSFGWPADNQTYGGSFLYHLDKGRIALGYVSGLDYQDPNYRPWEAFQQWKNHPMIKPLLEGGTIVSAGARAIVTGGYQSLPRVEMPGALLIGDTAGLLNVPKVKGTHQAIRSGMLAAEHLVQSSLAPEGFDARLRGSAVMAELKQCATSSPVSSAGCGSNAQPPGAITGGRRRNVKQARLVVAAQTRRHAHEPKSRARLPRPHAAARPSPRSTTPRQTTKTSRPQVADPSICIDRCTVEYGNPCTRFCPVGVYEIVDDAASGGGKRLQINSANCVHCKTCDIKDPYEIITWVTPEGGSGPIPNL